MPTYYVPSTPLDDRDTLSGNKDKVPVLLEFTFPGKRQIINREI